MLGLGLIGIARPGLPTVPFVRLSAIAATCSLERLHARLLADRRFGPMIRDWQARGAVSRRAKWRLTATMVVAAVLMWLTAPRAWMAATGTGCVGIVALWLWRRLGPPG